jgi:hypothetical protein
MMLHVQVNTTSVTSCTITADAGRSEVLDYDGDSELANQTERIAKRKYVVCETTTTTTRKLPELETAHAEKEITTSTSFSPSPAICESSSTASSSSRANFSAVIKVSSLQASFAEKTASEMEEIVGWYNQYKEANRFTINQQSKTLPNNAMVCDDDDDDDDVDDGDGGGEGDSKDIIQSSSNAPSKRKTSQTMQVLLEQSEAVKSILLNTQYMADIILELEQSSSSSDADNNSDNSTAAASSPLSHATEMPFDNNKHKKEDQSFQTIKQEDSLFRQPKKSRRLSHSAYTANNALLPWLMIIIFFIVPVLTSIFIAWSQKL